MSKRKVTISDLVPIDVWVTTNVHIYCQTTIWSTIDKLYQFTPARPKGFVILTKAHAKIHCKPLQGYRLNRPASLTISWPADKAIVFRRLTMVEGLMWYAYHKERWLDIGVYRPEGTEWGEIPL